IDHPNYKYPFVKATNQVYWESGEALSPQDIHTLINLYDSIKYSHTWQQGDIVMFDNLKFMHSKEETIEACERLLLARFGYLK
ncbi:MAG: TauD/TfdA family dioxygenase, partial [Campylobacterales bacterium]|nr:TauD/TfdA family dioxygenase [Campylobacterales bacterium]